MTVKKTCISNAKLRVNTEIKKNHIFGILFNWVDPGCRTPNNNQSESTKQRMCQLANGGGDRGKRKKPEFDLPKKIRSCCGVLDTMFKFSLFLRTAVRCGLFGQVFVEDTVFEGNSLLLSEQNPCPTIRCCSRLCK